MSHAQDLLKGAKEIAGYIGETERRTFYLLEAGLIPGFQQGQRWRMRKSVYDKFLADQEQRAISRANGALRNK